MFQLHLDMPGSSKGYGVDICMSVVGSWIRRRFFFFFSAGSGGMVADAVIDVSSLTAIPTTSLNSFSSKDAVSDVPVVRLAGAVLLFFFFDAAGAADVVAAAAVAVIVVGGETLVATDGLLLLL